MKKTQGQLSQSAASKDDDSYTMPHPIWTKDEVEGIEVSHRKPEGVSDRLAYAACMALRYIHSGAATCRRGFVTCFLRVPQAVGLFCSCNAARASKGNLQKTESLFYKLPPQTVGTV